MPSRKKKAKNQDVLRKKKYKEIKKMRQFSPYFANLLKNDKKLNCVIKNIRGIDGKSGANNKLFKVYGVHKSVQRYKKIS